MKFVEKLAITNVVLTQKKKILLIIILTLSILLLTILFLSGCKNSSLETLKTSNLEAPNNFETPDFSNENKPNCEDEKEADKTTTPDFKDEDNNSGDNNIGDDSPSDGERPLLDDDRTLPCDDENDSNDDAENNQDSNKSNESFDDDSKDDDSKSDNSKSDDSADEEVDDEVLVPERKLEIKLTTFEDKFSYTFSNGVIYKSLGTNNAVYLSFELFENSIKVSGARFEILVSTSDVTFDKVNYNSVYILVSKSCEFDLTIKTVDGEISKTIRVVVS